jgi:NAD(P)-dependent dehydrogenase (short-subunit alcohol dehydrogenase family)
MSWWRLFSLEGKTAFVTGGSRGIGRAIAELFADAGADVIVSSRTQADLNLVADAIRTRGRRADAIAADVGKVEDVTNLLAEVARRGLAVDILVNNAGIMPVLDRSFSQATLAFWQHVIDVNLRAPFLLSIGLGRRMAERGSGAIINVSTVAASKPAPSLGPYCVSKAALNTLTQVLAKELGPKGVRVNTLACGLVESAIGDVTIKNAEAHAFVLEMTPLGRHGQPREIAPAALYLASNAGAFTTGSTLVVDGGISA